LVGIQAEFIVGGLVVGSIGQYWSDGDAIGEWVFTRNGMSIALDFQDNRQVCKTVSVMFR